PVASGLSVTHNYLADGNYSVTLGISFGGFSFPAVIKVANIVTPANGVIQGPDTVCANSAFPYIFSVPSSGNAGYTWTTAIGSVIGLNSGSTFTVTYPLSFQSTDTIRVIYT